MQARSAGKPKASPRFPSWRSDSQAPLLRPCFFISSRMETNHSAGDCSKRVGFPQRKKESAAGSTGRDGTGGLSQESRAASDTLASAGARRKRHRPPRLSHPPRPNKKITIEITDARTSRHAKIRPAPVWNAGPAPHRDHSGRLWTTQDGPTRHPSHPAPSIHRARIYGRAYWHRAEGAYPRK